MHGFDMPTDSYLRAMIDRQEERIAALELRLSVLMDVVEILNARINQRGERSDQR
jgi:uncharacterized coiled-coil protein SlyX